ncbi:13154_t:CDS:2, partial [Ambispora leptoticha]
SLADLSRSLTSDTFAFRSRRETYRLMNIFEGSLTDLLYEESLAELNKPLEIKPNNALALRSRGKTYRYE